MDSRVPTPWSKMTKKAKVNAATTAKKVEKPVVNNKKTVKDSTEIDDLFSKLSSTKKPVTTAAFKLPEEAREKDGHPERKEEVTLSELEDLEDCEEDDDCLVEGEEDEVIVKGTAYDPKKDDIFPATSSTAQKGDDLDFFDSRGLRRKTRALTEDGLPIYTPKELKIGMGGGTDLCPFDCNCCF